MVANLWHSAAPRPATKLLEASFWKAEFGAFAACLSGIKKRLLGSLGNGFFGPQRGQEPLGRKFLPFEGLCRSTKNGSGRTRVKGNPEGTAARKDQEQEEGMRENMTGPIGRVGSSKQGYQPKEGISLSHSVLELKA